MVQAKIKRWISPWNKMNGSSMQRTIRRITKGSYFEAKSRTKNSKSPVKLTVSILISHRRFGVDLIWVLYTKWMTCKGRIDAICSLLDLGFIKWNNGLKLKMIHMLHFKGFWKPDCRKTYLKASQWYRRRIRITWETNSKNSSNSAMKVQLAAVLLNWQQQLMNIGAEIRSSLL